MRHRSSLAILATSVVRLTGTALRLLAFVCFFLVALLRSHAANS